MSDLTLRAQAWIDADPDPATAMQLQALLDDGRMDEVTERMNGSLEFGTAGLRGAVEAGSNRMNRAVIIRTTRGLADYLIERHGGTPSSPVVIGRDARLSSPQFMEDAISVLAAAGLSVRYWEGETPTPLVAYGALALDACAAIVVTASHNPPQDNGYKVYDSNGAQIVPPVDRLIAGSIERVGPAKEVPRIEHPYQAASVSAIERGLYDAYLSEVAAGRVIARQAPIRIVYTPMHGVGWQAVRAALHAAGHTDLHPVPEQVEPDGSFPTVSFPNPEEPGALDLAFTHADRVGADLVLANDPDADRLAVATRHDGEWLALTGNQIGVLLADHLLSRHRATTRALVVNSIVSSPMLADIAAGHAARHEATLTGFKWIANAAMDVEAAGEAEFVFGYEEALGYTVGSTVRDKDGVSAALAFADMVAEAAAGGSTVVDLLVGLYRRFGLWTSTQHSVVRPGMSGASQIDAAMDRLSRDQPSRLGDQRVVSVTDYRLGAETRPRWLGATPLVEFWLEGGGRALVRPSGTEPKLKIYVDGRADLASDDDWTATQSGLVDSARAAITDLVQFLGLK